MPALREPTRICYVIGSLDLGGTEIQLVKLALRLDRSRFQPTIVCLAQPGAMYKAVREAGIPVLLLTPPYSGFSAWQYWARVLRRYLAEQCFPLAHGFLFPTYSLLAVAAANARCPMVVVAGVRSLGLGQERQWPFRVLERVGNRLSHRIVANSEAVRQAMIKRDPATAPKLQVIYNGVDFEAFNATEPPCAIRRELGIQEHHLLLTVVANLIAYKGHRDILRAFRDLREARPEAKLALAGNGPEEASLRELAGTLGIAGDVIFLGLRSDVPRLLAATDIVVQGSYQEGFPNAILEAMAAGKPVVATRVGGVAEQVAPSVTGLLVDPGDVSAMSAGFLELAADEPTRRRMGQAARERAQQLFSWERTLREHEELYSSLLA